ncbi:MAG: hypothetical protein FIB02_02965 [Desulfuromonas sp.]|nr:hypothetical protein [Desulfuromonas sp.]
MANARRVADIEALRIAYRYRENELLKGMPVPRLRFRKVSISLPVMLTGLIPGVPAEINPAHTIVEAASNSFEQGIDSLAETLEKAEKLENPPDSEKRRLARYKRLLGFVQAGDFSGRFKAMLDTSLADALRELQISEGGNHPSDVVIQDVVGDTSDLVFKELFDEATYLYIQQRIEEEKGEFDAERARQDKDALNQDEIILGLKRLVRHSAEAASIKKATVPPDFAVTVNTDDIKNSGGGPDVVTRLSMVLMEEGLEWVTEYSHEGSERAKLVPE